MKHVSFELHEVNQLPGGFSPHIVGNALFLGAWDDASAIPMRCLDKTWQLNLVYDAPLEISFLLKPKGVSSTGLHEQSERRKLPVGTSHGLWHNSAAFRLPGKSEKDMGPVLEFPVSVIISEVSPLELGSALEKQGRQSSEEIHEYQANFTADPNPHTSKSLEDSPTFSHLRPHSMHSVLSIKDLVLMGKEAEDKDMACPPLGTSPLSSLSLYSPSQPPIAEVGASAELRPEGGAMESKGFPEASGAVAAAAVADGMLRKERRRVAIVMVGLPARGKTFTAAKLARYLRWLGHDTKHFNVGKYRRVKLGSGQPHALRAFQDSDFFRGDNPEGVEARHEVARIAFTDMLRWMDEGGQVGIFDATNSTRERRQMLLRMAESRCKVIFVESMCTDPAVIERNSREKIRASPDYSDMSDPEEALADFKARLANYEQVYEPVNEGSYIKLIDMVSGGGQMQVSNISGYLPGRIVFFLVNSHTSQRSILLTRHGESEANVRARIGGDTGLSPAGEKYALQLADFIRQKLGHERKASIWTSTLRRTILTARHSHGFPKVQWRALNEIDAGECDGMTYEEIRETMPEEYNARKADKLRYRYPQGESYLDVIQRLEPVIIELERQRSPVVVVAHQAILRALYAYFMDKPLPEIPHIEMPLNTVIELSIGVGVKEKRHKLVQATGH